MSIGMMLPTKPFANKPFIGCISFAMMKLRIDILTYFTGGFKEMPFFDSFCHGGAGLQLIRGLFFISMIYTIVPSPVVIHMGFTIILVPLFYDFTIFTIALAVI